MTILVAGLLAIAAYLLAAGLQLRGVLREQQPSRRLLWSLGAIAALGHTVALWQLLFRPTGIDLGLYRMAALTTWSMTVLVLLSSIRRPLQILFVVLFPIAAATLVMALTLHSTYRPPAHLGTGFAVHLILSVLAYALLGLAVCQSLLVGWQEHQLRGRRPFSLLHTLPPLQTMERLLFELLWVGLALLTAAIVSGVVFLEDLFAQQVAHKTVLSLCSWVVFAILLWGRYRAGWRGFTAIRWTLGGFALLLLAYFGSKLVIEVILS